MTDNDIRPQMPRCTPERVDDAIDHCGPSACHHCDQGEDSACRACILAAEVVALRGQVAESEDAVENKALMDMIARSRPRRSPEEVRGDLDGTVARIGALADAARANLTEREREILDTRFRRASKSPPPWLGDLARELRTQNNRATQHPLFVVQQEKRIWGMDSGYSDYSSWVDDEGNVLQGALEARQSIKADHDLKCHLTQIDPCDYGYSQVYYSIVWEFVTAHFTEKAAQRYINENNHNLTAPRIYVTSQYRCDEWNAVVEHLKGQP